MTPEKKIYQLEDTGIKSPARLEVHEIGDRRDHWLVSGMSSMFMTEEKLEEIMDLLNQYHRSELKGKSAFTRWLYGMWPMLIMAALLGSIFGMVILGVFIS